MNCHEVKLLIPDMLRDPENYPEVQTHIAECDACRAEREFVKQLRAGMQDGFPENSVIENIPARISLIRRIRNMQARRPLAYALALAAVLILTLILTPLLPSRNATRELYTYYENETLEAMLAIDLSRGMALSKDEVILYLIENEPMQTLHELSF